eukprot:COSAG01_NODE_3935_length_5518_cov_3.286769_11_plen_55_part_00
MRGALLVVEVEDKYRFYRSTGPTDICLLLSVKCLIRHIMPAAVGPSERTKYLAS